MLVILPAMGWILGMFTSLFLYAWLDERSDAYCGIAWSPALGLDSNYVERVQRHGPVIETQCAYCRVRTSSLYCRPCRVYYCTVHHGKDHRDCGAATPGQGVSLAERAPDSATPPMP